MVNVTVFHEIEHWVADLAHRTGVEVRFSMRSFIELSLSDEIRRRKLDALEVHVEAERAAHPEIDQLLVDFGDGIEPNKTRHWGPTLYSISMLSKPSWAE